MPGVPARPVRPDPVDIVFRDVRQLIVDDVRKLIDVDPARGDVRGDQDAGGPGLEIKRGHVSAAAGCGRMNGGGTNARFAELLGEAVRAVLGARED